MSVAHKGECLQNGGRWRWNNSRRGLSLSCLFVSLCPEQSRPDRTVTALGQWQHWDSDAQPCGQWPADGSVRCLSVGRPARHATPQIRPALQVWHRTRTRPHSGDRCDGLCSPPPRAASAAHTDYSEVEYSINHICYLKITEVWHFHHRDSATVTDKKNIYICICVLLERISISYNGKIQVTGLVFLRWHHLYSSSIHDEWFKPKSSALVSFVAWQKPDWFSRAIFFSTVDLRLGSKIAARPYPGPWE